MNPRTRSRARSPGRPARIECAIDRAGGRAARRRGRLPSASAVRRHARQQGRADAGARLRAARLDAACASTSAASARSEGAWDEGRGEVDDALAVDRRAARAQRVRRPAAACWPASRSAATSPPQAADAAARGRQAAPAGAGRPVDREAGGADGARRHLVIHGEADDVVPLAATLDWARPQIAAGHRLPRRRPFLPRADCRC